MKGELGDRIKGQYEDRTRFFLPRRTYTLIRVDGKAFHTFTRTCDKPFDRVLMDTMDKTAIAMCSNIQGAVLAYTQSDEISVLITDFAKESTSAWFDGNLQKMASVAASIATAHFNANYPLDKIYANPTARSLAMFDARVFTIPDPVEVENYFIWRQQDCTKNSLQMACRAVYSHSEMEGKGESDMHEMLYQRGINWNDYTSGEKRGRCIVKEEYVLDHKLLQHAYAKEDVIRTRWAAYNGFEGQKETPIFTQDRSFLRSRIPVIGGFND